MYSAVHTFINRRRFCSISYYILSLAFLEHLHSIRNENLSKSKRDYAKNRPGRCVIWNILMWTRFQLEIYKNQTFMRDTFLSKFKLSLFLFSLCILFTFKCVFLFWNPGHSLKQAFLCLPNSTILYRVLKPKPPQLGNSQVWG